MSVDHSSNLVIGFAFTIGEVRARSRALFPDFEYHSNADESMEKLAKSAGCGYARAYMNCYTGEGFEDNDAVFLCIENPARVVEKGNAFDDTIDFDQIEKLRAPLETLRLKLIDMGLSVGGAQIVSTLSIT